MLIFGDPDKLPVLQNYGDIIRFHRVKVRPLRSPVRRILSSFTLYRAVEPGCLISALHFRRNCEKQVQSFQNKPQLVARLKVKEAAYLLFSRDLPPGQPQASARMGLGRPPCHRPQCLAPLTPERPP